MLAFKEVSRNSIRQKNLRVEISDFGVWGANPKIKPLSHRWVGGISSARAANCNEVLIDPLN